MEEEQIELRWDKPYFYLGHELFLPTVSFKALQLHSNAVVIQIDGRLKSDLNWKQAQQQAQEMIRQGYYILWEIELGLFSNLAFPLGNQTQYLSLGLSLEHFRDTLWKEFKHKSLGVIVYRGQADFSLSFHWDDQQINNLREWLKDHFTQETLSEELSLPVPSLETVLPSSLMLSEPGKRLLSFFCRDVAVEYLLLLTSRLPDTLPCHVLLDAKSIAHSPLWQAQLLNPERFEQLSLAVKGSTLPAQAITWDEETLKFMPPATSETSLGICLPPIEMHHPRHYQGLEEALNQLMIRHIPFRLIPESHLITSWDGLDDLIFVPAGLSPQGKRKLQGFCAAGGTVVTLGQKIGLPYEINFMDFITKH